MRRLENYVTGQLMRPVLGVFLVILVIVLAFYFSRYLADAVVQRLSLAAVAQLAMLKLGLYLDVLIPASILLGCVLGLGRLQSGYEVTALSAAGVGRRTVVRSVLTIALLGLVAVTALSHGFRPWAYDRLYELEGQLIARVDLSRVEPGRFEVGDEQWMIFAERETGDVLHDVLVHQRLPVSNNLLRARRLSQRTEPDGSVSLVFSGDVRSYRLVHGEDADLVSRSETLTVRFDPPAPVERARKRRAMGFGELVLAGGQLEWGELQWRTLGPLSAVLLALVALAIARINPRRGQTAKLVTASLIVALYFGVVGTLANRVDSGAIPVWPGLFWVPLVLLPLLALRFVTAWRGPGAPL
ncbi:MAG: LptF/LptG family permease [Wenzhouxiangellaceae bacterium]|nr:LptF/LptG family permease [Wenzhouxiangellaceae bacterium]